MATLLHRLGKTAYRRWPYFIAGWMVLLIAVITVAAGFSKPMSDAFTIPGIPSEKAADLQSELFPGSADALDKASVTVVVAAPKGHTLDEPTYTKAVDALVANLSDLPQMAHNAPLANPVDAAASQKQQMLDATRHRGTPPSQVQANIEASSPVSPDGRVGTIDFTFDVDTVADVEAGTITALTDAMDQARDAGLTVEANGSGSQTQEMGGGSSELIGIGLALVVLLLTFGSFVAAGLPILSAVFGLVV